MSDSRTLLVTGFGPFGGIQANPSGDTAQMAHGRRVGDVGIVGHQLEVDWRTSWPMVEGLIREYRPQAILSMGVGGMPFIQLEEVAANYAGPAPDVQGQLPEVDSSGRIVPDAPESYASGLPLDRLEERLRARLWPELQAQRSRDAGDYLCNWLFFHLMHFLEGKMVHRGFVHLPPYPFPDDGDCPENKKIREGAWLVIEELALWLNSQRN